MPPPNKVRDFGYPASSMQLIIRRELGKQNGGIYDYLTFLSNATPCLLHFAVFLPSGGAVGSEAKGLFLYKGGRKCYNSCIDKYPRDTGENMDWRSHHAGTAHYGRMELLPGCSRPVLHAGKDCCRPASRHAGRAALKAGRPTQPLGFFPGCAGTYEKTLDIPQEWEGEKVFVEFDGVYGNTTVSQRQPSGLPPLRLHALVVDLTRRVRFGEPNRLEVAVDNTQTPNCRWYSGAGLYREVKLLHGPLCRIQHRGIFIKTESIDGDTATISAEVRVVNDGALPFHGHVDLTLTAPGRGGGPGPHFSLGGTG